MKKAIMTTLALSICIGCCACANNTDTTESSGTLNINSGIDNIMDSSAAESSEESSEESTEDITDESRVDSTDEITDPELLPGTPESYGGISVTVPDGMSFQGGEEALSGESYMMIYNEDEQYLNVKIFCVSDVNETIEPRDGSSPLTGYVVNGTEWNGITFYDAGDEGAVITGEINGQAFYIDSYGFAYDSDVLVTILSTLTYNA